MRIALEKTGIAGIAHLLGSLTNASMLWWLLLLPLFTGVAQSAVAGDNDLEAGYDAFAKANEFYTQENYEQAIASYEDILYKGLFSEEVYFNLANAHYKKNNLGPAIYYYEKALQISPGDEEIKGNLAFAQRMRMDQIEELPESSTANLIGDVLTKLSIDQWAYVGIVMLIFSVLFFILFRYTVATMRKRTFFALTIVLLLAAILCFTAAYYSKNAMQGEEYAIIMDTEIKAREEPKNTASSPFTLHEGTKVELLEDYDEWQKIKLANGSRAWLPKVSFREL